MQHHIVMYFQTSLLCTEAYSGFIFFVQIYKAREFFSHPFWIARTPLHPPRTLDRTHWIDAKFCVYIDFYIYIQVQGVH